MPKLRLQGSLLLSSDLGGGVASLPQLFLRFFKVGCLSFGGGSMVQLLIHQEVVQRAKWLDPRQFGFTMGLSRMHPGVHLLAQAVLIGQLLRGGRGWVAALLGLLLPSATITLLFTVAFFELNQLPLGRAAIEGIVPAVGGLALAMAYKLGKEQLDLETRSQRPAAACFMAASFGLVFIAGLETAIAVIVAGVAGALFLRASHNQHEPG